MRILAIDPGTKCGWALYDNGFIASGVWNLKESRFQGGGMRYVIMHNNLREVGRVDRIYYEEVRRHMSTDAAHIYGGMIAALGMFCEADKIPYEGVPVGTIKKHASGKGNSNKEQMIRAAQQLFPEQRIEDDNQADALCILSYALFREGIKINHDSKG